MILAGESLILVGESLILVRESLILIHESLILAGESLILVSESLILVRESLILVGKSLILVRESLILVGESLILVRESLILVQQFFRLVPWLSEIAIAIIHPEALACNASICSAIALFKQFPTQYSSVNVFIPRRSPQPPLKRGANISFTPFLRGSPQAGGSYPNGIDSLPSNHPQYSLVKVS
ncbi:hypothetical protein [Nostoc sp. WHI]|uniref:hypothetical protein n=2 Tax=Nostoc sp. WHI TaxID=2650611 RepID=UPI001E576C49|nr:hypothetical protein [Nostoc sp. WHI]